MGNKSQNPVWSEFCKARNTYLIWLSKEGKSQATIELYSSILNNFGNFLYEPDFPFDLNEGITYETVIAWKQSLIKKQFKQNTIRLYFTVLKYFFGWGVSNKLYQDCPIENDVIPQPEEVIHHLISDNDVKKILFADSTLIPRKKNVERDGAIVVLILECGLKVSDVIALQICDLDFNKALIHIRPKSVYERPDKTTHFYANSQRYVKNYLSIKRQWNPTDYLFGWCEEGLRSHFSRQYISQIIRSYCKTILGQQNINSGDLLWTNENSPYLIVAREQTMISSINDYFSKYDNSHTDIHSQESLAPDKTAVAESPASPVTERGKFDTGESMPIRHVQQISISEYAYSDSDYLSDVELPDSELEEFENQIKNLKLEDVDKMDGYQFQNFIADLFQRMEYKANVNKAAYDWGIDIIIRNELFSIGIQCKHSNVEKIDNGSVQEVAAGIKHYNLDKGMVITNNYFHRSTIQLARENNVILWDRDNLYRKIVELKNKNLF